MPKSVIDFYNQQLSPLSSYQQLSQRFQLFFTRSVFMNHQTHKNDHDQSQKNFGGGDYESLIRPVKTRETIAREYDINARTLRRWCKREGLDIPSSSLSPKYQRLIYETFGTPPI